MRSRSNRNWSATRPPSSWRRDFRFRRATLAGTRRWRASTRTGPSSPWRTTTSIGSTSSTRRVKGTGTGPPARSPTMSRRSMNFSGARMTQRSATSRGVEFRSASCSRSTRTRNHSRLSCRSRPTMLARSLGCGTAPAPGSRSAAASSCSRTGSASGSTCRTPIAGTSRPPRWPTHLIRRASSKGWRTRRTKRAAHFFLRLTCVIESDHVLAAMADRRPSSPTAYTILRRVRRPRPLCQACRGRQ